MMAKCKICGKEFTVTNDNRTICSDECRKENKKIFAKEYQKRKSREHQQMLGIRKCDVCGKEFHPRTRLMVRCSPACTAKLGSLFKEESRKAQKERMTIERKLRRDREAEIARLPVPGWQEGKRSYGKQVMQDYLSKQSDEMARRRRELDAEWERRKRECAVPKSVKR